MEATISKNELETGVKALLQLAHSAGITLPGILHDDPLDGVPDVVFESPQEALDEFPAVYRTMDAMRWALRNRKHNGLLDCGAVIEQSNVPGTKRPQLRIVHRNWVAHQRGLTNQK